MTNLIYDVALSFLGMDYLWGGKNPPALDCSGLVCQILRAVGECPPGDHNAQSLYDWFSQPTNHTSQDLELGALVFFGADSHHVNHVGMALSKNIFLEAGGGGSHVTSIQMARELGAFVKVRPIPFGANYRGAFLPDYHLLDR